MSEATMEGAPPTLPGASKPRVTALIDHLSSEISAQTSAMATWRSRVNFTAYFGPWIVFGGYFALAKVRPTLPELDLSFCVALAVSLAGYVMFGVGCGRVEAHVWDQCNEWRSTIVRLARGANVPLRDDAIEFKHSLRKMYFRVYLLMVVTFAGGTYILHRLTPASESSRAATSRGAGD